MPSLNKVLLIGNLTRDPEIRYTSGGAAICGFGLAVNRKYVTAKGEDRDETCFVDIDVWGKQAESCNSYLKKGAPAFVEGRLRLDQWDDRETGKKRSRLLVTAERVQFLSSGPSRDAQVDDMTGQYRSAPPSVPTNIPEQPSHQPMGMRNQADPSLPPFPVQDNKTVSPMTSEDSFTKDDDLIDDIPF